MPDFGLYADMTDAVEALRQPLCGEQCVPRATQTIASEGPSIPKNYLISASESGVAGVRDHATRNCPGVSRDRRMRDTRWARPATLEGVSGGRAGVLGGTTDEHQT